MPTVTQPPREMAAITRAWGENIRRRRQTMKWQQRVLAQILETDKSTICRWELGRVVPSDMDKLRIAGALGVHPNELFPWPDERPAMPKPKPARRAS